MVGVKPPGGMTMAGRGPIDGGFIESGKSLVTDDDQGNPSEVKCLELTAGLFNRESNKLPTNRLCNGLSIAAEWTNSFNSNRFGIMADQLYLPMDGFMLHRRWGKPPADRPWPIREKTTRGFLKGKTMDPYLIYRQDVIDCCQWLCQHGYFGSLLSAGGNVSVRIPGEAVLVITPSGKPYMDLVPESICVLDFNLNPIAGDLKPSIETAMHAGIYQRRPDVGAVVHTHQAFASIFALINQPIPALFDEVALAIGETVDVVPYAFSGTPELAENVCQTVANGCDCFIMQNHGALNLGRTLDQAWKNAELLEKTAQAYHHALATGTPVTTLPDETIERVRTLRE
jgi:L-fuculose-phosphate aldolase